MFVAGRYKIDDDFKVHNIITNEHPNGDYTYDPFGGKEVLPFWGVMCTTFWGLDTANREYIINNYPKSELENIQFKKFWLFWFSDGDINDQKELFFFNQTGDNSDIAKEKAYSVLSIFNHLLEKQVDNLIKKTKEEYKNGLNIGGIPSDIEDHIRNN